MAIYHFSAKAMRRAAGKSVTAAAAYRSGSLIVDARSGIEHDYTRKKGVLHSELILPNGGTAGRSEFWNAVEAHHKRKDAVLCREVEVSLPKELSAEQRQELAISYAKHLVDRYSVAADVCLHAPGTVTDRDLEKNPELHYETDPETGRKHNGNWHAHILLSACYVNDDGTLGKKAVELDPIHCQRNKVQNFVDLQREYWADFVNAALKRNKIAVSVDHRSLDDQGIVDRDPTRHLGPSATGYERRTGGKSKKRRDAETGAKERERISKEKESSEEMDRVNAHAQIPDASKLQAVDPDSVTSDDGPDDVVYAGSENDDTGAIITPPHPE